MSTANISSTVAKITSAVLIALFAIMMWLTVRAETVATAAMLKSIEIEKVQIKDAENMKYIKEALIDNKEQHQELKQDIKEIMKAVKQK